MRSVKSALRKSLGTHKLTMRELETVLCEVEQSVNSRPLTPASDNPREPGPLTPAHFLMEQPLGLNLQEDLIVPLSAVELAEKHSARQNCLAKFWKIWKDQYITNLPPVVRSHTPGRSVVVGDIVLIRDEPLVSRLQWPLAKVIKVHPGVDGRVRSVDVRTAKGIVCRPIKRLHKLEVCHLPDLVDSTIEPVEEMVSQDEELPEISSNGVNQNVKYINKPSNMLPRKSGNNKEPSATCTRSGRISRPPDRFNFK